MGGAKKVLFQFSPLTSTNGGISPQNFLTFSLNFFCHTDWKSIPSANCKLLNLNKEEPSKN